MPKLKFLILIAIFAAFGIGLHFLNPVSSTLDLPNPAIASAMVPEDAFQISDGDKTIFVIEQPHCIFCEKLTPELLKLRNVQVKIVLVSNDEKLKAIAEDVWCSPNPVQSWLRMSNREPIEHMVCDASALTRNYDLVKVLKITGTPAIVFPDGSVFVGVMTADEIHSRLSKI